MEAGNATNFIPNISALTSKHFTYNCINNGLPSAGQTMRLHHFESLVQAFFPALNKNFNIRAYLENICADTDVSVKLADNTGKPIY